MKKLVVVLSLLSLSILVPVCAMALNIGFSINDVTYNTDDYWGQTSASSDGSYEYSLTNFTIPTGNVSLGFTVNPLNRSISYAFYINNESQVTAHFSLSLPITFTSPINGICYAVSSIFVDPPEDPLIGWQSLYVAGETRQLVGHPLYIKSDDGDHQSDAFDPFGLYVAGPTGNWNGMEIYLDGTLDPTYKGFGVIGDATLMTGQETVPEPGTILLTGIGIISLTGFRRFFGARKT